MNELRELAKRLGNPIASADVTATPSDTAARPGERGSAADSEPRATLEKKLRAAAERRTES